MELSDGTFVQDGIFGSDSNTDLINHMVEGVVWKAYTTDDSNNLMQQGTEYDVILSDRRTIRARYVLSGNGYENGTTRSLHPTTKTLDGSALDQYVTELKNMDGDRVVIQAIFGLAELALITHKLPHPKTKVKQPTKSEFPKELLDFQGTKVTLDKAGRITVDTTNSTAQEIILKSKDISLTVKPDLVDIAGLGANSHNLATGSTNQALAHFLSVMDPLLTALVAGGGLPAAVVAFATALQADTKLLIPLMGYTYNPVIPVSPPPVAPLPATDPGGFVVKNLQSE